MTTVDSPKNIFSQNDTKIIKGIAILFMILHHTTGKFYNLYDPVWYLENSDSWLSLILLLLSTAGKVCVPLFTILSGYGLTKGIQKIKCDNPRRMPWARYSI